MKRLNFTRARNLEELTNMPQMNETLNGWEVPLTLEIITQDIIDGYKVEKKEQINFKGVWQPLRDKELQFKPEGLRTWEWIQVHAKAGTLNLEPEDNIIFNSKRYKVMSIKDYSLNGYIEYHLIRDYQNAETYRTNNC